MTHPCADHPCDGCYSCTVLGICCLTQPASGPAQPAPVAADQLADAVRMAAAALPSGLERLGWSRLADAVRSSAIHREALPAPSVRNVPELPPSFGWPLPHVHSHQEASHVQPS